MGGQGVQLVESASVLCVPGGHGRQSNTFESTFSGELAGASPPGAPVPAPPPDCPLCDEPGGGIREVEEIGVVSYMP